MKFINPVFSMSKRKRFILTSILSSVGFVAVRFVPDSYRMISIFTLGVLTVILFVFSLREGLGLNMTLLSLILPFFFTTGVGFFWFLLPTNVFARIPVIFIYGIGIYALCLTLNIYTVAAIRTIALLRAARGVGFVLSLLTFFLVFDTILSLRASIFITVFLVVIVSLPLFLQGFWSISLEKSLSKDVLKMTLVSSLIMGEIALILFFWPTTVVVGSLFFTVATYIILGLVQSQLEGRLFSQTIKEHLYVGIAVSIGMFLATRWGS